MGEASGQRSLGLGPSDPFWSTESLHLPLLCSHNRRTFFFVLYVSKQDDTNHIVRYNQIHIELFAILGAAQDGQFSEVVLDYFKCLFSFIRPVKCGWSSKREEEMSQLVCETGYETPTSC